jgi:hypothetical protein
MIRRAALTAVYILVFAIGGAFLAPSLEFWAGVVVSASCGGPLAIDGTVSAALIPIPELRP